MNLQYRKQLHLPRRKRNWEASNLIAHVLQVGNGVGCTCAARVSFFMQIKLPNTSIYGNSGQSSGQSTTYNYGKVSSSVGHGVCLPWAAFGNFAMQMRLPITSIYRNSGRLRGQPTTFKYPMQTVGSPLNCPQPNVN